MDKVGSRGKSLVVAFELKKAMNMAIKECGLSREQVADRMNELLQAEGLKGEVTRDIINSWTKEDPRRLIPTGLITFFCAATHSVLPIVAIARELGALVVAGQDLDFLEIGRAEYEKQSAREREMRAWANLGINHPFKLEK